MSKRRASGDGSVYQLADGSWRGVVDLGWHDGRRRRKYVRGATKAEVVRTTRRFAQEAEAGRLSPQRAPTMAAWMDRYLSEVASTTVRPSTLQRYRQEVRLYIGPALGKIRIDQLRAADVSRFYQDQLQRLSPGSVRRLHALLRRSLAVAVRWQLINWNPILAVDPPSIDTKEIHPLSADEAHRFLLRGSRRSARGALDAGRDGRPAPGRGARSVLAGRRPRQGHSAGAAGPAVPLGREACNWFSPRRTGRDGPCPSPTASSRR